MEALIKLVLANVLYLANASQQVIPTLPKVIWLRSGPQMYEKLEQIHCSALTSKFPSANTSSD